MTTPDENSTEPGQKSGRSRTAAIAFGAIVLAGLAAFAYVKIARPGDLASALNDGYYATAREMLEDRANGGDSISQNMLGNLHYLGLGGPQDHTIAVQWYFKAAFQNNSNAQVNIARHYRLGLGIRKDPQRGIGWLQLARSNGNEIAEGHMKLQLSRLELTPNQIQKARQMYRTLESLRPLEKSQ